MKVILTEGARTQDVIEFGGGFQAWQRARVITYMVEPCTLAQAQQHLDQYKDGCIVLAKRGPKGGWVRVSYTTRVGPRVSDMARFGLLMHLGRMTPKGAGW